MPDGGCEIRRCPKPVTPRTTSTPEVLARLCYDGADLAAEEAGGAIRVTGDRVAAERFLTFFALPDPATSAGPVPALGNLSF